MKGYGEQVAALPFTTNQEDLLSLYGFMRGHGPLQKREPCARKIDLSRKRFDATATFRCLPREQVFLPAKDARSDRSPQASGMRTEGFR
jgi:hypothetical protein